MYVVLCIPRIENEIELHYIRSIFTKMKIGEIKRIFDIPLRGDNAYKRVMIHMDMNEDSQDGLFILERLNAGKDVKIVHKIPSYWKVVRSRTTHKSDNHLVHE